MTEHCILGSLRRSRLVACATAMAVGIAVTSVQAQVSASPPTGPTTPPPKAEPTSVCLVRVRGYEKTRAPDIQVEPGPAVIGGALVMTRVDVELDEAPLSSALKELAKAARVNLLPLYRTRESDSGLDRDLPVTLSLENVSAQEALEAILAAATGMVDTTWQIRGNVIECGPKVMLAESSRRVTRVYDITDVRLEVPYYEPQYPGDPNADRHRRLPKEISADFARLIINNVEPEAWREPEPLPGGAPTPALNLDGQGREEIFVRGQWASLHMKNDTMLVVNAPDFIQRQIGGMGTLIPPLAVDAVDVEKAPGASGAPRQRGH